MVVDKGPVRIYGLGGGGGRRNVGEVTVFLALKGGIHFKVL